MGLHTCLRYDSEGHHLWPLLLCGPAPEFALAVTFEVDVAGGVGDECYNPRHASVSVKALAR